VVTNAEGQMLKAAQHPAQRQALGDERLVRGLDKTLWISAVGGVRIRSAP
jgi:hypothetical protein